MGPLTKVSTAAHASIASSDAEGTARERDVGYRLPVLPLHRRGRWRSFEVVEFATLEWVDWFNNRRLLEPTKTASDKPGAVHVDSCLILFGANIGVSLALVTSWVEIKDAWCSPLNKILSS